MIPFESVPSGDQYRCNLHEAAAAAAGRPSSQMNMNRNNSDEVVAAAARFVKGCLWLSSWVVAVWWLVLWLLLPTSQGTTFEEEVEDHVYSRFFGNSGN